MATNPLAGVLLCLCQSYGCFVVADARHKEILNIAEVHIVHCACKSNCTGTPDFIVPVKNQKNSRKRYVHEKLFNQMRNELYARRCERSNTIETNTEYSEKFSNMYCDEVKNHQSQKKLDGNFKLHGEDSMAISFWNTVASNGRGHFKQYHPLTKLNGECLDEQWR